MVADPRQPQRLRSADQLAEDAAAARQRADPLAHLVVDPDGEEASQLALVVVEDAERRVPRPGELARGLDHLLEHGFGIVLGDQPAADFEQAQEVLRPKLCAHGHQGKCSLTLVRADYGRESRLSADTRSPGSA